MKGGDNVNGNFPSSKIEALALLYVQTHHPECKSPAQLLENYQKAYEEIEKADTSTNWEY